MCKSNLLSDTGEAVHFLGLAFNSYSCIELGWSLRLQSRMIANVYIKHQRTSVSVLQVQATYYLVEDCRHPGPSDFIPEVTLRDESDRERIPHCLCGSPHAETSAKRGCDLQFIFRIHERNDLTTEQVNNCLVFHYSCTNLIIGCSKAGK